MPNNATAIQKKNVKQIRDDIITRYYEAPDLKSLDKNAYRLVNAVADHATHAKTIRNTAYYLLKAVGRISLYELSKDTA